MSKAESIMLTPTQSETRANKKKNVSFAPETTSALPPAISRPDSIEENQLSQNLSALVAWNNHTEQLKSKEREPSFNDAFKTDEYATDNTTATSAFNAYFGSGFRAHEHAPSI